MDIVARVAAVLVGAIMMFVGLSFWFTLDAMVASFGFGPEGLVGRASVRADVGSFFIGAGLMAFHAAWKRNATSAACAALLIGLALLARLLSTLLDGGVAPGGIQPVVLEAIMVAVLVWARSGWQAR